MYTVYNIDLGDTTNNDGKVQVQPGQRIAEMFILAMPVGASMEIALGESGAFFTISGPFTMEPDGADVADGGLRIRNLVAQVGSKVQMVVVFGASRMATTIQ